MLEYTASFWSKDLYSHGYLIPLIAAYLLWARSGVTLQGHEGTFFWAAMIVLAYKPIRLIAGGAEIPQWQLVVSLAIGRRNLFVFSQSCHD